MSPIQYPTHTTTIATKDRYVEVEGPEGFDHYITTYHQTNICTEFDDDDAVSNNDARKSWWDDAADDVCSAIGIRFVIRHSCIDCQPTSIYIECGS